MSNSFVWSIDRNLSGATILGQSGPGNNGNERVLWIPQSSSITGASTSDYLMSYPGLSLGMCYSSEEMQSVYSTAPDDWVSWVWKVLHLCKLVSSKILRPSSYIFNWHWLIQILCKCQNNSPDVLTLSLYFISFSAVHLNF